MFLAIHNAYSGDCPILWLWASAYTCGSGLVSDLYLLCSHAYQWPIIVLRHIQCVVTWDVVSLYILGHTKLISCFLDRWEAQIGSVRRQKKKKKKSMNLIKKS